MPSKDANGKRLSGGAQRKKQREAAQRLRSADPLPTGLADLPPPPADDLDLQVWGARCAATLAHLVLTSPSALTAEQWRFAREYLATLGLLFPRAHLVKRAQKELKRRQGSAEEEELTSLEGIRPGPTSRTRRGAAG